MLTEKHQAQGSGVSIFTSYSLAKFPIFQDQEQEKHTTFESDQRCTKHPRNGRFHCPNLIQHRPCIFMYLGGIMNTELWGLRSQTELIECGSPHGFYLCIYPNLFCLAGGTFIGLAKTSTTAAPVRTRRASYTGILTNCDLLGRAGSCGSMEHTSRMP